MPRHLWLLLLGSLLLCLPRPAAAQEPSHREQLDKLLEAYKAYGLPLPPKDAKLVRYRYQMSVDSLGRLPPARYGLALFLKPADRKEGGELLVGSKRFSNTSYDKIEDVAPRPESLEHVVDFGQALFIAIQCHEREWFQLAEAMFERSYCYKEGTSSFHLAHDAWDYWTRDLTESKSDWSKIAGQLKIIMQREPKAFEKGHRDLVRSIDLSLKRSVAKRDAIESVFEEFIRSDTKWITTNYDAWLPLLTEDPRYAKIACQGFAAVPKLIAYLDDERLTRTQNNERDGLNVVFADRHFNMRRYPYRIKHIASKMIMELACMHPPMTWHDGLDYLIPKKNAEDWWKDASAAGEEPYLLHRVLRPSGKPRSLLLSIVAEKHPHHLGDIYRKVIEERPDGDDGAMAEAVATSKLSIAKKRGILVEVASSKNLNYRCDALTYLKDLDEPAFEKIMIATLDALPKASKDDIEYVVRTAQLAAYGKVWDALSRAMQRAVPSQRFTYLELMGSRYNDDETTCAKKVHWLQQFLDDKTVRELSVEERDSDSVVASEFVRLEVRNFVAWKIAQLVEEPVEPRPRWTDAEWAELRAKAKAAVVKAGVK